MWCNELPIVLEVWEVEKEQSFWEEKASVRAGRQFYLRQEIKIYKLGVPQKNIQKRNC